MKTILLSIIIIISSISYIFAATAEDYFVVLENISESCPKGRQLIFRDTDGDGEYDTIRKTNCDGSYEEDRMIVHGGGSFGRIGAHGEVISGDVYSNAYKVRIYFPEDNSTLGYVEKLPMSPAIFTFSLGGH